jgi:hypothetical protein
MGRAPVIDPLHNPPNAGPIERLYAIVSIDKAGNMGICASILPGLGTTPMVTGSRKAIKRWMEVARTMPQAPGKRLAMVVYERLKGEPEWL